MNKKNILIIAVFIVVVILAVVLWPGKDKNPYNLPTTPSADVQPDAGGGGGGAAGASASNTPNVFPLKKGDKNDKVKDVQKAINYSWAYFKQGKKIAEDGAFGSKTVAGLADHFSNPEIITEGRYNWIMQRYNSGVPLGRNYKANNSWPIMLGDYDVANESRIKKVNIALGLYAYNTNDPNAHEFNRSTTNALYLKLKKGIVTETDFAQLMQAASYHPTIYIN